MSRPPGRWTPSSPGTSRRGVRTTSSPFTKRPVSCGWSTGLETVPIDSRAEAGWAASNSTAPGVSPAGCGAPAGRRYPRSCRGRGCSRPRGGATVAEGVPRARAAPAPAGPGTAVGLTEGRVRPKVGPVREAPQVVEEPGGSRCSGLRRRQPLCSGCSGSITVTSVKMPSLRRGTDRSDRLLTRTGPGRSDQQQAVFVEP